MRDKTLPAISTKVMMEAARPITAAASAISYNKCYTSFKCCRLSGFLDRHCILRSSIIAYM